MGLRIVVADDNRDATDSLSMLLEMSGHEVHRAYDGATALELCRQARAQVALLDLGMPRMNGYAIARLLGGCREQNTLLIAITGFGREADRVRARDAGFAYYFVKPIQYGELETLLGTLPQGL